MKKTEWTMETLDNQSAFMRNIASVTTYHKNTIINEVLDKIRAEITAIAINGQVDEHTSFIRTGEQVKQMALNIIDKYKPESEK